MTTTTITIEIDGDLYRITDKRLMLLWHIAQANPAPHAQYEAGELAEKIGREIIRRWLRTIEPDLYHHQGRSYYWNELRRFAKYVPPPGAHGGSADFHQGHWVAREPADDDQAAGSA